MAIAAILIGCIIIWICINDIRSTFRSGRQHDNVWLEAEIRSVAISSLALGVFIASTIYFVYIKVKDIF